MCSATDRIDRWMVWFAYGSVIGGLAGAFVLPLDWDRAWQSFPVPCIIGSASAALIATFLGLVIPFRAADQQKRT